MTTIKINPEQLYQIAQQVDQGRQQLDQMNRQLYGHLVSMQMLWLGMTQERFFQDYEHSRPVLERALEHMVKMAVELRAIATRFSEADAEQGGYQAAIGGAVGLGTQGASTDTEPGYRMAYNSFLGKWLPVNEKGVTDQAALQAYERDKGHLDVNAMQGDVHSKPLGEDLMALQIKAFQEGIHPFTGERVSDNYAAMMVTTLKLSQVFMGIQAIRGSLPGRKGPYHLPSNHPVVQKIQKNIEAVKSPKPPNIDLIKMGTGAVGDFQGAKDINDLISRVPADAKQIPWREVPGGAKEGVKFRWVDEAGKTWDVRAHSVDPSAPIGSNAANGWIYRVEVKQVDPKWKWTMDSDGNFHKENVLRENSPYYNGSVANETHIPFTEMR